MLEIEKEIDKHKILFDIAEGNKKYYEGQMKLGCGLKPYMDFGEAVTQVIHWSNMMDIEKDNIERLRRQRDKLLELTEGDKKELDLKIQILRDIGYTQEETAERLGVSRITVARREKRGG